MITSDAGSRMNLASRALAALICLLPPVAIYAPKGMVPLACLAAAVVLTNRVVRSALCASIFPPAAWAIAPLLAWGLASVFWTQNPGSALALWVALITLVVIARVLYLCAATLSLSDRERLAKTFVIGGILFIAILAAENLNDGVLIKLLKGSRGGGVSDYMAWINPGNAGLAIFALPFAAGIARHGGVLAGGAALAAAFGVVAIGPSTSATVALLAGILAFILTLSGKRPFLIILAAMLALGQLAFPTLIEQISDWERIQDVVRPGTGSVSIVHRWIIWDFVNARIAEHPFIGWGFDASRAIPGGKVAAFGKLDEVLPLHPHNGFLQVWLELGGIGAVFSAVLLAAAPFLFHRVAANWQVTAIFSGTLSSYMVLGQLSYGIWQNWWISSGILALTLVVLGQDRPVLNGLAAGASSTTTPKTDAVDGSATP